MKKVTAIFLAVMMLLIPLTTNPLTFTASADTKYGFTYWVMDGEAQIDGYVGSAANLVIPSTLDGYPVTAILATAFYSCTSLKSVTIPNTVTIIDQYAFSGCTGLTSISIPNSVTFIGERAFNRCINLTSVNLSDNLKSLGIYAFYDCSALTNIKIPNGVTTIGKYTFFNCRSLKNIILPNTLNSIDTYAFYGCTNLVSVTIPDSISSIGAHTFDNCTNLKSVTFSSNLKSIGEYAFYNCASLTGVSIPNSVTSIGKYAFSNCSALESVTLPYMLRSIEMYTFSSCTNLTSISIPTYTVSIGVGAFYDCIGIKSVTLSNNLRSIGDYAFHCCSNLTNVWYTGAERQNIEISSNNLQLEIATWHYNTCTQQHNFSDGCDAQCDNCEWVRIPLENHVYTNTCDENCNLCGNTRTVLHNYNIATCSAPKTCVDCGTITGSKLAHKYDSGKVTKVATCKATGVKTYTCSVCKGTKTETIAKLTTHTYGNNCDKSCNVCGKTRTVGAHEYTNSCDTTCNYCGEKRTIKHTYSNNCDTSCNVCKATRTITHAYKTTTTKATLSKNGSIVKKCTVCGKVASNAVIKYAKTFKLSATEYTYNGGIKTPSVTVKDSAGKALKKNTDYTVTYASDRKNVGTYKVTIKGKGNYTGTKTLTFKINPAKTTISKLTAGKKSITVAISKKSTQVTGYQIQYGASKTFSKATTKIISSYKTTKYTLNSLSAKKTYYVRVRTYKTVGKTKYYSDWSTYKYVKTK